MGWAQKRHFSANFHVWHGFCKALHIRPACNAATAMTQEGLAMTTLAPLSNRLASAIAALALSIALIGGTVSVPQQAPSNAISATTMEYAA